MLQESFKVKGIVKHLNRSTRKVIKSLSLKVRHLSYLDILEFILPGATGFTT